MNHWLYGRGIVNPVRASTAPTTDGWVCEQPDTGIWGSGKTQATAIEDLRHALVDHRDVLMSSNALAPHLSRQRRFLNEHLAQCDAA
jgi:hypothetical protein